MTTTNLLTEEQLAEIDTRARIATPPPWLVHHDPRKYVLMPFSSEEDVLRDRDANAAFCANAREDVPRLVAPALTEQQRAWVLFALRSPLCRDKKTGLACFNLRRVSDEFDGVKVKDLMPIATDWQSRGWLLPKPRADASRPISQTLRDLVGWVEPTKQGEA